jgi:ADP-ribosyl-[dinitrogen reductase] hydrolase
MTRTSVTHPLQIASIPTGEKLGRVGITFCPGKYDEGAASGSWDRDLNLDIDAIRDWGAAAVVTLVESHELALLRVEGLGEAVVRRGMRWFHFPIADVSTPDGDFERRWAVEGEELRALLRGGRDVLVHCRGGLGRAGTIGARLLVELGMEPAEAIRQVRSVRPGAIETSAQERYVRGLQRAARRNRGAGAELTLYDRVYGCLLGGACGDALGAPVEFLPHENIVARFGIEGITQFATAYGGMGLITDDTQMALFTVEGLIRAWVRGTLKGICHPPSVVHHAYLRWLVTQDRLFETLPEIEKSEKLKVRNDSVARPPTRARAAARSCGTRHSVSSGSASPRWRSSGQSRRRGRRMDIHRRGIRPALWQ